MQLQILLNRTELKINNICFLFPNNEQDFSLFQFKDGKYVIDNLTYLSETVELIVDLNKNIISILFDSPEFFSENLLSSKIINRFLKKYCLNDSDIVLEHPTRFKLKKTKTAWDEFIFYYDAHQGDISLEIKFNLV